MARGKPPFTFDRRFPGDARNTDARSSKPDDVKVRDQFVAVDIETTGLSAYQHRIVEIGGIKVFNGKLGPTFSMLVNPGVPIPGSATRVNGITDAIVKDSPGIETVLPQFVDFIGDLPLVIHNACFDMSFLQKSAAELGLKIANEVIDSLWMCRRLFPNLAHHNLQTMVDFFGATGGHMHRALNDCHYLAQVYLACAEIAVSSGNATKPK